MEKVKVKIAKNEKDIQETFNIRNIVFGEEQGISRDLDFDGNDKNATHVIEYYNGKPIGCARIRIINNKGKLERIAVLKEYRGKGFGEPIMEYLIKYCKGKMVREIYFDAQAYLRSFYKKFGFEQIGKPFEEVGREHIKMGMKLK